MTTARVRLLTIIESIVFVLFAIIILFGRANIMRNSYDRYNSKINYVYSKNDPIILKEECCNSKGDTTYPPGTECYTLIFKYNNPDNASAYVRWVDSDGYNQSEMIRCRVDSFVEADQIKEAVNSSYLNDQKIVRKELIISTVAILIYSLAAVGAAFLYCYYCIKHPSKKARKRTDSHPVIYGILEGAAVSMLLIFVAPIVIVLIINLIMLIYVHLF